MKRALLFAVATVALATAAPAATPTPPNPFIDKGACPFECCTYRAWTTNKPVTLVDKPGGTKSVLSIPAKTVVQGVTGQVWSVPLPIKALHDFADSPIKKGNTFYALHSEGEGFWTAWFKGKTYTLDMTSEADNALLAKSSNKWWVQIKTKSGQVGWVLDDSQFDNQDSCG